MATGFTGFMCAGMRHCNGIVLTAGFAWSGTLSLHAQAANVTVVGLFPGKAVVVINGASPRTISVGQKQVEGVTLLSTASSSAIFNIDGKRHALEIGEHFAAPSIGANGSNTLKVSADTVGQFWTMGQINGKAVRFLIDTGATSVALPAIDARTMGIDFTKGQKGYSATAGGIVPVWKVKLDAVTIGEITLYGIEASIFEGGLNVALLGMSFLNRVEMKREGAQMTLTKRF
ncbi:MAG: TIGR02281 family clan AA aspartic protease [Burkholderiales bacterium]|nr:TIGR02281 family clan AA aspartic protease [Burkholderiales bacterium]